MGRNGQAEVLEPARHVLTLAPGIEMAFRLIPAGTFRMGSRGYFSEEEPIHRVRIVEDYWMGETPVTQAQLGVWTAAEGVEHRNQFAGNPDNPADNLSWQEANRYCAWLTRTYDGRLPPGYGLACLPTEAEWEYACRVGTETEYATGDGEAALQEAGWFDKNSGRRTKEVRGKSRNDHWLWDMHGNVWEWCHDVWEEQAYRGRVDGDSDVGWAVRKREWANGVESMMASEQTRVLRGGSWIFTAGGCRTAFRIRGSPDVRDGDDGFRVCLVRGPAAGRGAPTWTWERRLSGASRRRGRRESG